MSAAKKVTSQARTSAKAPEVKERNPKTELLLDPENPRLAPVSGVRSQDELLNELLVGFRVEELAQAIVSSGYIDHDPIIAYRTGRKIFVREGNRRLAAIKLLLNPELSPPTARLRWQELARALTPAVRGEISKLRVVEYDSIQHPELESYIGFRHVSGVLKWPAEQKAQFVAELIERHGWSYAEIARRIGSYPKHVERNYVASQLMKQAEDDGMAGAEEMQIGVLLRALQSKGIAPFLGVTFTGTPADNKEPVSEASLSNFRDFVRWTFGTEDTEAVLNDSRKLTKWGQVLASADAVRYLRSAARPSFDRAWMKSGGREETTLENLLAAADRLEEAAPLVPDFAENAEVADAVEQCFKLVARMARDFPEVLQRNKGIVKS